MPNSNSSKGISLQEEIIEQPQRATGRAWNSYFPNTPRGAQISREAGISCETSLFMGCMPNSPRRMASPESRRHAISRGARLPHVDAGMERSLRSTSTARFFAVVITQADGFDGRPRYFQTSSAWQKAPWTTSWATARLWTPKIRASCLLLDLEVMGYHDADEQVQEKRRTCNSGPRNLPRFRG